MRKVVETTGRTYDEAVDAALTELGAPRDCVEVMLLHTRDTDRRRPGPEEYTVRVWECAPRAPDGATDEDLNLPPASPFVCERTAPSFEEAVRGCLDNLGIAEDQADIQVLRREDTNPLKAGPERVTVRVWRRRLTEPAPVPGAAGSERISDIHAAAHLPDDGDLSFEPPHVGAMPPTDTEVTQQ